jgi:pre-mRNA-splicing factor CWC22
VRRNSPDVRNGRRQDQVTSVDQSALPFRDFDRERAAERARQLKSAAPAADQAVVVKTPVEIQTEQQALAISTRSGGAYIPPARLRAMQAQITDKSSEPYQRMTWDALKKSINGLINKVRLLSTAKA